MQGKFHASWGAHLEEGAAGLHRRPPCRLRAYRRWSTARKPPRRQWGTPRKPPNTWSRAAPASTDVRRTAGGLAAGGAHEGSRPPKTAAAAGPQTLPRLHSSEAKTERGARRIQGTVDALACPAGAHGKGRRCGQTQRGGGGVHRGGAWAA